MTGPVDAHLLYETLAAEPAQAHRLRAMPTGVMVTEGEVLAATDSTGRRLLLVPTQLENVAPDHTSTGVSLVTTDLHDPSLAKQRYLVMACEVSALSDLFASVASDALAAIQLDPNNPEKACYDVVERYRQLFARRRGKLLDERGLAALLAELLVVERFVKAGGEIEAWTGPANDRHDLRARAGAIEVKSTLSTEHRKFVCHGLRQLEAPEIGPLFLHLVRLEPQIGGTSVPDVVNRLRVQLTGSEQAFITLLAKDGYDVADEDAYRNTCFSVLQEETHAVEGDFPRLVESNMTQLPSAISGLTYTVDLAAYPRQPLEGGLDAAISIVLTGA